MQRRAGEESLSRILALGKPGSFNPMTDARPILYPRFLPLALFPDLFA